MDKFEKKYDVIGKGLEPEEEKRFFAGINKAEKEGSKPLEGELEKTPEELKVIEKINELLNEEFKELDIKRKISILPEQIHFLPDKVFKKKFPKEKSRAIHEPLYQAIYINKSNQPKRPALYKTMLHESIHLISVRRYYAYIKERKFGKYRSGYLTMYPKYDKHEHFRGLNEAVCDKMTFEILKKHKKELIKEFNITSEELQRPFFSAYSAYIDILDTIIEKIAEKKKENKKEVWQKFKRGVFSGNMMHLRDIERIFGKGALRVVAALASGTEDLPEEEINKEILRYFETDNEKKREKIANEVLIEKEKVGYWKRRAK